MICLWITTIKTYWPFLEVQNFGMKNGKSSVTENNIRGVPFWKNLGGYENFMRIFLRGKKKFWKIFWKNFGGYEKC